MSDDDDDDEYEDEHEDEYEDEHEDERQTIVRNFPFLVTLVVLQNLVSEQEYQQDSIHGKLDK